MGALCCGAGSVDSGKNKAKRDEDLVPKYHKKAMNLLKVKNVVEQDGTLAEVGTKTWVQKKIKTEATVMVSDMFAFTRLSRQFGIQHYSALIVKQRQLALPILQSGCSVLHIGTEGDNLIVAFDSPAEAIRSALEVRAAIEEYNKSIAEERAHFRIPFSGIGLHTEEGLLVDRDGELHGRVFDVAYHIGETMTQNSNIVVTADVKDRLLEHPDTQHLTFTLYVHDACEIEEECFEVIDEGKKERREPAKDSGDQQRKSLKDQQRRSMKDTVQSLKSIKLDDDVPTVSTTSRAGGAGGGARSSSKDGSKDADAAAGGTVGGMQLLGEYNDGEVNREGRISMQIESQFMVVMTALMMDLQIECQDKEFEVMLKFEFADLVKEIVTKHNGHAVEALLHIFQDPLDALEAAMEIKATLEAHEFQKHERMESFVSVEGYGIHTGEMLFIPDTDIHWGDPVNVSSQLGQDFAKDGEVVMTKETRDLFDASVTAFSFEAAVRPETGVEIPAYVATMLHGFGEDNRVDDSD